jgi:hypothetical protein
MQQGRVQLDADWNEQLDIDAHFDTTMRRDIIGPCGAPKEDAGFALRVTPDGLDLMLTPGRIYVDGILCELESTPVPVVDSKGTTLFVLETMVADEHELKKDDWVELTTAGVAPTTVVAKLLTADLDKREVTVDYGKGAGLATSPATLRRVVTYLTQPDFPGPRPASFEDGSYLAYLDVWEQHVTALEDRGLRETALGGIDTATRTKATWQLRLFHATDDQGCGSNPSDFAKVTTGRLAARAQPQTTSTDPCTIPPGAGYRRLENQLYRVEIHRPGNLDEATFKWSRENGSVVSPWLGATSKEVEVSGLGRDDVLGFTTGNLVELTSDLDELGGTPGKLMQVSNTRDRTLIFADPAPPMPDTSAHPKVRRWEGQNAVKSTWLSLEDGVEVQFAAGWYNTGDYWEIPARAPTGDVEWAHDSKGTPLLRAPDGIAHSYCKLAALSLAKTWQEIEICRPMFPPLTDLDGAAKPDGEPKPDARIQVEHVQTASERPLQNDSPLGVSELANGIDIVCDAPIDPETIRGRPTCLVTVDLPYPFTPEDGVRFGTFPVTLDADARAVDKVIQWRPKDAKTVESQFSDILGGGDALLLHLTLKGNFVYGAGKPELNVDGEVFGVMKDGVLDVTLPLPKSGDGRRGGDLEMWFRLKQD